MTSYSSEKIQHDAVLAVLDIHSKKLAKIIREKGLKIQDLKPMQRAKYEAALVVSRFGAVSKNDFAKARRAAETPYIKEAKAILEKHSSLGADVNMRDVAIGTTLRRIENELEPKIVGGLTQEAYNKFLFDAHQLLTGKAGKPRTKIELTKILDETVNASLRKPKVTNPSELASSLKITVQKQLHLEVFDNPSPKTAQQSRQVPRLVPLRLVPAKKPVDEPQPVEKQLGKPSLLVLTNPLPKKGAALLPGSAEVHAQMRALSFTSHSPLKKLGRRFVASIAASIAFMFVASNISNVETHNDISADEITFDLSEQMNMAALNSSSSVTLPEKDSPPDMTMSTISMMPNNDNSITIDDAMVDTQPNVMVYAPNISNPSLEIANIITIPESYAMDLVNDYGVESESIATLSSTFLQMAQDMPVFELDLTSHIGQASNDMVDQSDISSFGDRIRALYASKNLNIPESVLNPLEVFESEKLTNYTGNDEMRMYEATTAMMYDLGADAWPLGHEIYQHIQDSGHFYIKARILAHDATDMFAARYTINDIQMKNNLG